MNSTQGAPTAPPPMTKSPARRKLARFLWGSLGVLIVLGVLYTLFMLWYSYSEGDRAGVLQKFSKRGWVCKTYEGELALYVVGGIAPQIWNFSVRDEAVAEQLQKAVGQHVRIHYAEHRGLPTDCFGETDYFATGLELIRETPDLPSVAPTPIAPTP